MNGNNFPPMYYQQDMVITSRLQYNAPSYAPQLAACFGTCPSGTMKATAGRTPGYLDFEYIFPAAKQRPYHPLPNAWHSSAHRVAYLPDTAEGRKTLLRFQYAFLNGLCLSVGRSQTLGLDNQIIWSHMLPHKTGTTNGPHNFGFPDPTYLPAVSIALDRLGVPSDPQVCRQWIQQNQASLSVAAQMGNGGLGAAVLPPTIVVPRFRNQRSNSSNDGETIYYSAASSPSADNITDHFSKYLEVVSFCKEEEKKEEECPICLEAMVPNLESDACKVVCIKKCKHRFHKKCIQDMFQLNHTKCPNCRQPVGIEPRGQGPSGSMSITIDPTIFCRGYQNNSDGTITLRYNIQNGIQLPFMENPGQHYSGTSRVAYLPNNEAGRKLMSRLKYAFTHGLTFRVGTSLTTGRSNQTTWTSIHHKTSLRHGVHGYPDPNYFDNCNASLDALRVPNADDCT